ncbi:hypothetical protein [Variovorax boronicumulans]|nr:hypothetical protein [Variovorax boronicumulans]
MATQPKETWRILLICVFAFRKGIMGEIIAFIDTRKGRGSH